MRHTYSKTIILLAVLTLFAATVYAQKTNSAYEDYISKYADAAKKQQKLYGIPASITLAQALLESAAGQSELAKNANNHFGVKCGSGWTGKTYRHTAEKGKECFRKYDNVEQSYEDHSLFLKRPHYQSLFKLKQTDYKGWAHGLRQCGYATDPQYAHKLIRVIEDYELYRFDKEDKSVIAEQKAIDDWQRKNDEVRKSESNERKERKDKKDKAGKNGKMKAIDLYQEHKLYKHNGRKYIIAAAGETFEGLAYEYNISEKALRRYNDATDGRELRGGDKVYLFKKRSRAQKNEARYRVKRGDTAWSIAQDKGIQLKTIYRLNGITEGLEVTINQELQLR